MANEDILKEVAVETTKEIAQDVYEDGLQPAMKNTGGILGTITGFFNHFVLYPLKKVNIIYEKKAIAFERKMENQPYYCMHHYQKFLEVAKDNLKRSKYADFERLVSKVNNTYLQEVTADVSWFCKKFDYRYDEEPWGNAKDAPERAIKLLCGSLTKTSN